MYVSHKNTNLQNAPPPFCKLNISLTYLFISPINVPSLVTEKSRTPPPNATAFVARRRSPATTSLTLAARRTPPPPPRTRMQTHSPTTTVRPWLRHMKVNEPYFILFYTCVASTNISMSSNLQKIMPRGAFFQGRSLTVSLILSRIFSLYQQLSGRVWLRRIRQGTPTKGAPWMASRGSSRSST
jgi:hypothetical protein